MDITKWLKAFCSKGQKGYEMHSKEQLVVSRNPKANTAHPTTYNRVSATTPTKGPKVASAPKGIVTIHVVIVFFKKNEGLIGMYFF